MEDFNSEDFNSEEFNSDKFNGDNYNQVNRPTIKITANLILLLAIAFVSLLNLLGKQMILKRELVADNEVLLMLADKLAVLYTQPYLWLQGGRVVLYGEWYRLITCMFIHGGLLHLFCNASAMWSLGNSIEIIYGKIKYLVIFFGSGICGGLASVLFNGYIKMMLNNAFGGSQTIEEALAVANPSVGASGAIFGLVGALLAAATSRDGARYGINKKAILKGLLRNLALGILLMFMVDNSAHIGGFIGGFLIAKIIGLKK